VLGGFLTCVCYQFLIKHKFYREKALLHFYILAYLIIIFRIIEMSLLYSIRSLEDEDDKRRIQADAMGMIVLFCRILMGITEADKRVAIATELGLVTCLK
jgi:hypothetical protein